MYAVAFVRSSTFSFVWPLFGRTIVGLLWIFGFFFCLVFFVVYDRRNMNQNRTRNSTSRKHSHAMGYQFRLPVGSWGRECVRVRFFSRSNNAILAVMPQPADQIHIYLYSKVNISFNGLLFVARAREHVSFIKFPHQFHTKMCFFFLLLLRKSSAAFDVRRCGNGNKESLHNLILFGENPDHHIITYPLSCGECN